MFCGSGYGLNRICHVSHGLVESLSHDAYFVSRIYVDGVAQIARSKSLQNSQNAAQRAQNAPGYEDA